MMKNKDFVVFILTHGRPEKVYTLKSLLKHGYTGKYFLVCDDEDKKLEEYKEIYGDKVLVFSKDDIKKRIDVADNFNKRGVILYARNKCFEFAEELGYTNFLELDDDYTSFNIRYIKDNQLKHKYISNLDSVFDKMVEFLHKSNAYTVAFAQGGDYIGGINGSFLDGIKRKAMNTLFCTIKRPFKYIGSINEDVNTYTLLGSQGKLFLTIMALDTEQKETQSNSGGMTETYLDGGTYLKSFYSIICMPSAVKISMMGNCNMRIHHKIKWNNCVPKILNEKYKRR